MKTHQLLTFPLLWTLASAPALAQTAPSSSVPGKSAPVVTDVAPPPPEDRSSTGAIVLEQSPVKAQRDAQREAHGEAAQEEPAAATRRLGAGPLTPGAAREGLGREGAASGSAPAEGARAK